MWGGWDQAPVHCGSALQAPPVLLESRETHGSQDLKALGDGYFKKKKRLFKKSLLPLFILG